jgi:hypothetical protein
MNFDKIHNVSKNQLEILIYARFIMIIICAKLAYCPCKSIIKETLKKGLSLLKFTHYLMRKPHKLTEVIEELKNYAGKVGNTIKSIARYCSYDKRKRLNFEQEMDSIFSLS